jgi:hypothetical protein
MTSELAIIKTFKAAGFGIVQPRVDVFTFRLWLGKGYRPIRGTRSVRVGSLRLFHRSQVYELSMEEGQAIQDQKGAGAERQEATSSVVRLLKDA